MNVISCSRRSDIPRYHPDWLEARLAEGRAVFRAPGGIRSVPLYPARVHSIVLWSKDYGPVLARKGLLGRLERLNPYFHFTITGLGGSAWEPGIPRWEETVLQLRELARLFGPERVNWRFDPVVHWTGPDGDVRSNTAGFDEIARAVVSAGVSSCVFSFASPYRKSRRRIEAAGLSLLDPDDSGKSEVAGMLASRAAAAGIGLASCAGARWEGIGGIGKSSCVDGARLSAMAPGRPPADTAGDASQRKECGCTRSVDIGSYAQRCIDPCLYCYAN